MQRIENSGRVCYDYALAGTIQWPMGVLRIIRKSKESLMETAKRHKGSSFPTRQKIREAEETLSEACEKLHEIGDQFNLEWGDNHCCDLDLALTYALRRIEEAQTELQSLLRLRRLGLNFRGGRSWV